ncbi:DUF6457 domain-containing protein [Microbacterium kribbense]
MSNSDADREKDDEILRAWSVQLTDALEVHGLDVDIKSVLGLAGRAAHGVLRPAAPLTTFVAGYAAGIAAASGDVTPEAAVSAALDRAFQLCREHAAAAEQA